MLAATQKTLIAALGALAGLAAIAVTPASALADARPSQAAQAAQAADVRRAAAALIAGPHDRDMHHDMRRGGRPDVDPAGGRSAEAYPFNATGESEKPSVAAVTAETDNAQRLVRRLAKRRVTRKIKRRNKSKRRARHLARRRY